MITFYPRDIGIWRKDFDFQPQIAGIKYEKVDHREFLNREEFIQFLVEHGVRVDDPLYPLRIESTRPEFYFRFHDLQDRVEVDLLTVVQWSLLGWITDSCKKMGD